MKKFIALLALVLYFLFPHCSFAEELNTLGASILNKTYTGLVPSAHVGWLPYRVEIKFTSVSGEMLKGEMYFGHPQCKGTFPFTGTISELNIKGVAVGTQGVCKDDKWPLDLEVSDGGKLLKGTMESGGTIRPIELKE